MKRITTTVSIAILIMTALISVISTVAYADEKEKKEKQIRIKWESLEGIIRYMVQIRNADNAVVLDRSVATNHIDFLLPPGKYQIRIGAVNKFDKVSFWTEWESIEIRKSEKNKFFANKFPAQVGLKINGGISYNMVLPPWNSLYRSSPYSTFNIKRMSYMGSIGFHFGDSKYVTRKNAIRFMGIELDFKYTAYSGKNSVQFRSQLTTMTGGPNIFFKTNLEIPLNFYLRVGGGVSYSQQKYTRSNLLGLPLIHGNIHSLDPYVKVGASVEVNFLYAMSLNIGADYYVIFYNNKYLQSLHYYAMIGVRI